MSDLGEAYETSPPSRGDCFEIVFGKGFGHDPIRYEPAVGRRCRVVRRDDGTTQECGGAVRSVSPYLRVSLDGEGWH